MVWKNGSGAGQQKVLNFIKSLHLPKNTSRRLQCPNCQGNNSFSISNEGGKLKWYCFRASCGIKGIQTKVMTLTDMKEKTKEITKEFKPLLLKDCVGWEEVNKHPKALEYLKRNGCTEAVEISYDTFFYDKIQDRVVFTRFSDENCNSFNLATGRNISDYGRAVPKWYKYIAEPHTYYSCEYASKHMYDNEEITYIVEDCASACSISRFGYSVALCGTTWDRLALAVEIEHLTNTYPVVICLDKDAQDKALKLQKDLQAFGKFKSVTIKCLSDDPKYLSLKQLTKELS